MTNVQSWKSWKKFCQLHRCNWFYQSVTSVKLTELQSLGNVFILRAIHWRALYTNYFFNQPN